MTLLNRQRSHRVDARSLARFLQELTARMPPDRGDQLAVCLVSDAAIRCYNRRFRGQDRPTDVLCFPGDRVSFPEGGCHLGDIVVSVPQAAAQARKASHSLGRELKILLLHGYLHLLGFDHETDTGAMMRVQRRLIRALLPRSREGEG